MGWFSKKKKYLKDEMPNFIMIAGVDIIGKLRGFNDVNDNYAMAVNLDIFMVFLECNYLV